MVVVNVGGASVRDPEPQLWIKSVRAVMRHVPLVILSDREDLGEIRAAFKEGARGFIATSLEPSLALHALTFLHRGGSFFPTSVLEESTSGHEVRSASADGEAGAPEPERRHRTEVRRIVRFARWQRSQGPSNHVSENGGTRDGEALESSAETRTIRYALTPRQSEVLERLREGKPNKVIARDLNMTEATVKVHVRQIMRKFGAANRTQVVLSAMRYSEVSAKPAT